MRLPLIALAAVLVPAFALSADVTAPTRKAGWWEISSTMTLGEAAGGPVMSQKMHLCTDPATESRTNAFLNRQGSPRGAVCTDAPIGRTATGWTFATTCTGDGVTMTTQGAASGDFGSAYRIEAVNTMDKPPTPLMGLTRMLVEAKWVGDCPAGREAGQMVLDNGAVVNLNRGAAP
jgi:hypothetical protein